MRSSPWTNMCSVKVARGSDGVKVGNDPGMPEHLVGLLLGTEEDWPTFFEMLMSRLEPVRYGGEEHRVSTGRIKIEPFALRARPRYRLVVDRLAWWYYVPREWLKKVALMDDVYLLN